MKDISKHIKGIHIKKRNTPNKDMRKKYSNFLDKSRRNSHGRRSKKIKDTTISKPLPSSKKRIQISPRLKNPNIIKKVEGIKELKTKKPMKQDTTKQKTMKQDNTKKKPKKQDTTKQSSQVIVNNKLIGTDKKSKVTIDSIKNINKKKKISKGRRFSKKRKLHKKHTKSRRVSFRCYPQNTKNIDNIITKANNMSNDELRKELLNNGIEIKGNKSKLLKDIYMFSSLGGIKINRE